MVRVLVLLFWVSLVISTLIVHNLVANWAVTLAGLYFLARWWNHRSRERRAAKTADPAIRANPGQGGTQSPSAGPLTVTPPPRSRWTSGRVHTPEQRWR